MAKNKNRKQSSAARERSSQAERASQEAKSSAAEARSDLSSRAQGSPADVARKHQRRFGHN